MKLNGATQMHNHIIENTVLSIVEHLVHKENRRSDKNKKVNTLCQIGNGFFRKTHLENLCCYFYAFHKMCTCHCPPERKNK